MQYYYWTILVCIVLWLLISVSSLEVVTGNLAFLNFQFPGIFMSGFRGNFFYFSKDFSDTDTYHSDIKNVLLQIKIFFAYSKLFCKIFEDNRPMLVRSKFFPLLKKSK